MSANLKDYMDGIFGRLAAFQAPGEILNGVAIVREGTADVGTQVDKAVDQTGMLIIIGIPRYDNTMQSQHVGNMKMATEIAIGENPTLWRNGPPNMKPPCLTVEKRVRELLQGFGIVGFQPLRVMTGVPLTGKKGQVFSIQIEAEFV